MEQAAPYGTTETGPAVVEKIVRDDLAALADAATRREMLDSA